MRRAFVGVILNHPLTRENQETRVARDEVCSMAYFLRACRFAAPFSAVILLLALHAAGEELPAKILDLKRWRLTLPVDTPRAGTPDEISAAELQTFTDEQHFFVRRVAGGDLPVD